MTPIRSAREGPDGRAGSDGVGEFSLPPCCDVARLTALTSDGMLFDEGRRMASASAALAVFPHYSPTAFVMDCGSQEGNVAGDLIT